MKTSKLLAILLGVILLGSCANEVTETVTYKINEPVFMSNEMFRKSVRVSPEPQELKKQGKIAFFKGFMYI